MANKLSGHKQYFHGAVDLVDTSQEEILGARGVSDDGNEFVYLKGISSIGAGSWITYNQSYETALLTAGAVGHVAIAIAEIDSTSKYGWFQIYGINTVAKTDTIAANTALYIDGTNGRVDDLGVIGDLVIGAYSLTADTNNVATVAIVFPHVSNDLGLAATSLTSETPVGDIDDSNTTFTVSNTPTYVVINGAQYAEGEGLFTSYSGGTITLSQPIGTGGFITSWYQ